MEPHERMHHIFHNLLRKLFIAIGHDIFRGEFKPYSLTFFIYGMFALFSVACVYTIFNYDILVVLSCTGIIGLGLEVRALNSLCLLFEDLKLSENNFETNKLINK